MPNLYEQIVDNAPYGCDIRSFLAGVIVAWGHTVIEHRGKKIVPALGLSTTLQEAAERLEIALQKRQQREVQELEAAELARPPMETEPT